MTSENSLLPRVWELERSLASAVRVNEALRQQLASRDAEVAELNKQVTLLRDALMFCQSKIAYMLRNGEWYNPELALDTAREALAATEPK